MTQSVSPSPWSASWAAAEEAVGVICAGKGNLQTVMRLVGALVELRLSSLVEPVLAAVNVPLPEWQAQRAEVVEKVRMLPGCGVSWESREAVFAGNVAALISDRAMAERVEKFWREHRDQFALHLAQDGNYQVVDRSSASIFSGFVGGLNDHRALVRQWKYASQGLQTPAPVTFDGAGYGWLLGRVLETTHKTFLNYSTAVYVIEPDLVSACILLNLHDLREWGPRIRLFVGPHAAGEFTEALSRNDHWMIPAITISERIRQRPAAELKGPVLAVAQERSRRTEAVKARIDAHYSAIKTSDWAERFREAAGGRPLRVMGVTSRYTTVLQYSMDELGAAIRAARHEFILCKEADDQSVHQPMLELIDRHKPDLLVMISRLRYENPLMPRNIPFLCWDQDNLPCMRTDAAGKSLDALTYAAGIGARLGYEQLDWPRQNCILAFQAAATHRYSNAPADQALLRKHRCTFSYTSNASGSPIALAAQLRSQYAADAVAASIFQRAAGEVLARAGNGYAWDIVQTAKLVDASVADEGKSLSAAVRQEMIIDLRLISDRAFRHVALGWVAEYCRKNGKTLRLYGKGWEANPQFAEFAAGFQEPGEEMRAVCQASAINLQIIETGFLHSRVLDGLAAGGFFLYRLAPEARDLDNTGRARLAMTRRAIETGCVTYSQLDASTDPLIVGPWKHARPIIRIGKPDERCRMLDIWEAAPSEEFQFPGLNEITFADRAEFNVLADRFLADPQARATAAERLRQIVVERFSYDTRWQQFLAGITDGLEIAAGRNQPAGASAKAA